MQNYIGLYYPYIHFRNESWLKLAALYWDKMARIVPNAHNPYDSDTVRKLRYEIDFVENLNPHRDVEKVAELFLKLIESDGQVASDPLKPLIWQPPSTQKPTLRRRNYKLIERYSVQEDQEGLAEIYCGKVAYELSELLLQTGLAVRHRNNWELLRMNPKLASVYMTALAKEMAASRQFHPVTENDREYIAIAGSTVEQLAQLLLTDEQDRSLFRSLSPRKPQEQMAYIAIQSILPTNIESVPIDKIIEVRNKYGDELRAFQNQFHSVVTDAQWLKDVSDVEALQTHLEVLCDETIGRSLRELKANLKSWGIETTLGASAVQIAIPSVFATGVVGQLSLNPLLAGIAAVAFSPVPVLLKARTARQKTLASSSAAYLFHLEEELTPTTLVTRLSKGARRMTYGV